jgi:hypothetical protein
MLVEAFAVSQSIAPSKNPVAIHPSILLVGLAHPIIDAYPAKPNAIRLSRGRGNAKGEMLGWCLSLCALL